MKDLLEEAQGQGLQEGTEKRRRPSQRSDTRQYTQRQGTPNKPQSNFVLDIFHIISLLGEQRHDVYVNSLPKSVTDSVATAISTRALRIRSRQRLLKDGACNKKLSYRRGTARCVVSIEILPIATQQCRNYLYDKS